MGTLRFDDRVVVITGAGGQAPSLGRTHAHFFAERGAKVVVNDLGVGPDGRGTIRANAEVVAEEIRALGGDAIADTHSVAEEASARDVISTALEAWGRVDILVNNANVAHLASFDEFSGADIQVQIDVHLMGTIWMCRAAWPHMKRAGYGRIVNIASNGVWGGHHVSIYGAAKGGIFALSNNLSAEGQALGITVNTLAVGAATKAFALHVEDDEFLHSLQDSMPTELVSPAVGYLAHEECPVTGKFFMAAGGMMAEFVSLTTTGFRSPSLTIEDVRDNFAAVRDRSGAYEIPPPSAGAYVPKPYVSA